MEKKKSGRQNPDSKSTFNFKSFLLILSRPLLAILNIKQWSFAIYDFSFLLIMLVSGLFLNKLSYSSLSSAFLLLIISIIVIVIIYAISKFLFYKRTGLDCDFKRILWKHPLALLIIALSLFFLFQIAYWLLEYFIMPDQVAAIEKYLRFVLYILPYLIFLNYYLYEKDNIFVGVWKSFKDLFSLSTLITIYNSFVILIIGYILSAIIVYLFQVLLVYVGLDMQMLNSVYEFTNNGIMLVVMSFALSYNKIFRYNIHV